jgi:hypothetical protein
MPATPDRLNRVLVAQVAKVSAASGRSRGSRVSWTPAEQEALGPITALHTEEDTVALHGWYSDMHIS